MTTSIAVVNRSTLVSDDAAALMTRACASQMQDAASLYGRLPWHLYPVAKTGPVPEPGLSVPIFIFDDPDQAGALGYHTEDGKGYSGKIFARPVLDTGGTALVGNMSVACVLSHEVLETFVDWSVNMWADRGDGTLVAREVCDPVEGDSYIAMVDGIPVSVSNFVLDQWFDPQGGGTPWPARFDFLHKVTAPFAMTPGGYMMVLHSTTGIVDEVYASTGAFAARAIRNPHGARGAWRREAPR